MSWQPDYSQRIFRQRNVRPRGVAASAFDLRAPGTYNLGLYVAEGSSLHARNTRGVLVVHIVVSFVFENTRFGDWLPGQSEAFIHQYRRIIHRVWSDKYPLTTDSRFISMDTVQVSVHLETIDVTGQEERDESTTHWTLWVRKVANWAGSWTRGSSRHGLSDSGDVQANRFQPGTPNQTQQRAVAHEFGHMLGLRDEYSNSTGGVLDNPHHLRDFNSVMNTGEAVAERHYAPFAEWVSLKWRSTDHGERAQAAGQPILFRVAGAVDTSNAGL